MATLANLIVNIGANTSGFKDGIDSASQTLEDFGTQARKIGQKATIGITTPILAAGTAVSTMAADTEEMRAKSETVFGEMTDDVRNWARSLSKEVKRSRFQLERMATNLQDIFVPMGFARDRASELSRNLAELAVDVGSFNNVASSRVMQDFQSALVGQSRAVLKYGVNAKAAAVEQELLNMGIEGGADAATRQQKVLARMNILFQDTADAQGDAARTANSFTNTLRGVRSMLSEIGVMFGRIINPVIKEFVQKNIIPAVEFVRNLSKEKKTLIAQIAAFAAAIGPALIVFGTFITLLGTALPAILSPLGALFAGVLGVIVAELATFWDSNKTILQNLKMAWNRWKGSILSAWNTVRDGAKFVFQRITKFWKNHRKSIFKIGNAVIGFFKKWGKTIIDTLLGAFSTILDTGASVIQWFRDLPTPIKAGIGGLAGFAAAAILIGKAIGMIPFAGTIGQIVILNGVMNGSISKFAALIRLMFPATNLFLGFKFASKGVFSVLQLVAGALGLSVGGFLALTTAVLMVVDAWNILAGEFKVISAGIIRGVLQIKLAILDMLAKAVAPMIEAAKELGIMENAALSFGKVLHNTMQSTRDDIQEWSKTIQDGKKQIAKGLDESLVRSGLEGVASGFMWLKDTLVGNSIVPDMNEAIRSDFSQTFEDIQKTTKKGVNRISKTMSDADFAKGARDNLSKTITGLEDLARKGGEKIGKTLFKGTDKGVKEMAENVFQGPGISKAAENVPVLERETGRKPILERTPAPGKGPIIAIRKKDPVEQEKKNIMKKNEMNTRKMAKQKGMKTEISINIDGKELARELVNLIPGEKLKMGMHPT